MIGSSIVQAVDDDGEGAVVFDLYGIVPAAVGGEWVLKDEGRGLSGTLSLGQRYQRVGGTLALGGKTQPLLGVSMDGEKLSFGFIDDEGNLRIARMKVAGNSMTGTLSDFRSTVLTASKRDRGTPTSGFPNPLVWRRRGRRLMAPTSASLTQDRQQPFDSSNSRVSPPRLGDNLSDTQALLGRVAAPRNQTFQRLAFGQAVLVFGVGNAGVTPGYKFDRENVCICHGSDQ